MIVDPLSHDRRSVILRHASPDEAAQNDLSNVVHSKRPAISQADQLAHGLSVVAGKGEGKGGEASRYFRDASVTPFLDFALLSDAQPERVLGIAPLDGTDLSTPAHQLPPTFAPKVAVTAPSDDNVIVELTRSARFPVMSNWVSRKRPSQVMTLAGLASSRIT